MPSVTYPPKQDYFAYFADVLRKRIPEKADVLEIGSGPALHPTLQPVRSHFGRLTGIDPGDEVLQNPFLDEAIRSPFESYDFKGQVFDAAFAFNVLEHLSDPSAFATHLAKVVKPGGWFWSLAPHSKHPFARMSRCVERLGLKPFYRKFMRRSDGYDVINDYPSYYRINDIATVRRFMSGERPLFDEAEFMLLDANWDCYFPKALKWAPILFDSTFTRLFPQYRLLIVMGVRIANPAREYHEYPKHGFRSRET